jgi:hypothetical protein
MEVVTTQANTQVQLFAGDFPRVRKPITLVSGAGVLTKGTVLGKITKGAAVAAAVAENTGDGILTMDSTTPILAGAKAGVYKVKIIRAAIGQIGTTPAVPARLSVAALIDPDGNTLEVFDVVAAGVTISNHVKFAMTEGSTAYVLGDSFTITIAAGSGKYKAYDKDNLDGTEIAVAILAENADDATSADKGSIAYFAGDFNNAALTGFDGVAEASFEGTAIFIGAVL